jgi:hypothetical protein
MNHISQPGQMKIGNPAKEVGEKLEIKCQQNLQHTYVYI